MAAEFLAAGPSVVAPPAVEPMEAEPPAAPPLARRAAKGPGPSRKGWRTIPDAGPSAELAREGRPVERGTKQRGAKAKEANAREGKFVPTQARGGQRPRTSRSAWRKRGSD